MDIDLLEIRAEELFILAQLTSNLADTFDALDLPLLETIVPLTKTVRTLLGRKKEVVRWKVVDARILCGCCTNYTRGANWYKSAVILTKTGELFAIRHKDWDTSSTNLGEYSLLLAPPRGEYPNYGYINKRAKTIATSMAATDFSKLGLDLDRAIEAATILVQRQIGAQDALKKNIQRRRAALKP